MAGVKAPSGSLVAARWGDKPTSSTSAAVIVVAAADHAPQAGVDYYKMAAEQQRCEESLQLAVSPSLQVQRRQVRGVELLCDLSTAVVRPILPAACRREVFAAMHYTSPEGFKYIFTVIDRSTRWLEAVPVKNLEATTAADALVESWISRFGVSVDITSDRGTQFLQYMRDFPPLPLPTRPLVASETVNKVPEALMQAKFVYVRRGGQAPPLTPLYSGPYEVMEAGRKVFKVNIGGKIEMFTVDRLKPHLGTAPLQEAKRPVRGRPAKQAASGSAATSGVGSEGDHVEAE